MTLTEDELVRAVRSAPWDQVHDAYGIATPVAEEFVALLEGDPESLIGVSDGLDGRIFHQGTVYEASAVALPLLVDLAELGGPRGLAGLLLVLLVLCGKADDAADRRRIDAELPALAVRLDALAEGAAGLAKQLALVAAGIAARRREPDEEAWALIEEADDALSDEGNRILDEQLRSPAVLQRRVSNCAFGERDAELDALVVIGDCLRAGQPAQALALCERLTVCRLIAEPERIRALVELSRILPARRAAVELARAWLEPASSVGSPNQVLTQRNVLEPLRRVREASPDTELDALIAEVAAATPEVFLPEGDVF